MPAIIPHSKPIAEGVAHGARLLSNIFGFIGTSADQAGHKKGDTRDWELAKVTVCSIRDLLQITKLINILTQKRGINLLPGRYKKIVDVVIPILSLFSPALNISDGIQSKDSAMVMAGIFGVCAAPFSGKLDVIARLKR